MNTTTTAAIYSATLITEKSNGRVLGFAMVPCAPFWAVTQPAYESSRPIVVMDAEEDGSPLTESRAAAWAHALNSERASLDA